jgi:CheY-like chemotaxis protein
MAGAGTEERRDTRRTRMLKGGYIAFSARHATIPCVVRDISDTGAKLQVAQSSAVPDTFELIVELDGLEVPCLVVRRKMNEVGVTFLEAPHHVNPKRAQVVGQTGPAPKSSLRRNTFAAAPQSPAPAAQKPSALPLDPPEPREPAPEIGPLETSRSKPGDAVKTPSRRPSASERSIPLLIAEDDPDDRLLMIDAFEENAFHHPIDFVENGEELLRYVRGEGQFANRPLPGIILLDLNMPKMDGRTALMHLKTDSQFKRIPVVVLTTSNAEEDIQRTYDLGVTAYVSKPSTQEGLGHLVKSLADFWTRFVRLPTP